MVLGNSNKNTAASDLRVFLEQLRRTYEVRATTPAGEKLRISITLAITGLDDWLLGQGRFRPLQVAVIGPTQVGKSTVVNLLLGSAQAASSPLAAYTEQLHGFAKLSASSDHDWIKDVLHSAAMTLEMAKQPIPIDCMIWDTPDFDSHRSHGYRELIAKVAALADVFVLVVSKEKYADLSVWETLRMLKPLQRPLVICLNKISADHEILDNALRDRLEEFGWGNTDVPVFNLPYTTEQDVFRAINQLELVAMLRARVLDRANQCDEACRMRGMQRVIADNWQGWLQPVKDELVAVDHWHAEVNRCLQNALADYQAQYLNHAHHDDAFNRTILQLLELLEIPGIGEPLSKIRRVLTWPVRKVFGSWQNKTAEETKATLENVILGDIVDHALLSLHISISRNDIEQNQAALWWAALGRVYSDQADRIRTQLPEAVSDYQQEFAAEIEKAAHSIYLRLQENPVVLNTLRATRLSADLAGVAIAVKTGDIGVSEALLTPAVLSVTSTLTEGAVGKYVGTIRKQLKDQQCTRVEELLYAKLASPLLNLQMDHSGLFNINHRKLELVETTKRELLA